MGMKNNKSIFITAIVVVLILVVGISAMVKSVGGSSSGGVTLEKLYEKLPVDVTTVTNPTKGSVNLGDSSLYDELPEIDKYPLAVEGNGDVDIEIFTSGEKAGDGNDSWLIDCAENFNSANYTTSTGARVSMSVRAVSSGMAADYIISGKYEPDLYTPSNELFGEYAMANGAKLEEYNTRLVGNTAGLLVRKNSGYTSVSDVVDDVIAGNLNIGYTNPQTSATGLNLLIEILKDYGDGTVGSEDGITAFTTFNNNIPFVAYTTQQMATSASNGTLDGMVTEYQAYVNDKNLKSTYDFIPFGMRHDNPLYIVNPSKKSDDELEAIEIINTFLESDGAQQIATEKGFNANDSYESSYEISGSEVTSALSIYKENKDAGRDIIAVFVADCSGSMDGDAIIQLRESLSNGSQYINSNNYIGLVSYSSDVTIELPIAQFDLNQKAYFQGAVDGLSAGGSTSTYEALVVAMNMIEEAKADKPDAKTMIFLLSDGQANGGYTLSKVKGALQTSEIPVYTIAYTSAADTDQMKELASVNEATAVSADSDDVVYKIKSLFNSQL